MDGNQAQAARYATDYRFVPGIRGVCVGTVGRELRFSRSSHADSSIRFKVECIRGDSRYFQQLGGQPEVHVSQVGVCGFGYQD